MLRLVSVLTSIHYLCVYCLFCVRCLPSVFFLVVIFGSMCSSNLVFICFYIRFMARLWRAKTDLCIPKIGNTSTRLVAFKQEHVPLFIYIHIYIYIYISLFISISMCIYIYMIICTYIYISLSLYIYIKKYNIYIYIY